MALTTYEARVRPSPRPGAAAAIPWPWTLRLVAVACLFGCEVIHTVVMEPHLIEWIPAGLFFFGLSVIEGLLGVGLLLTHSRRLSWVAIIVTGATLAVWAVSRGPGLPFGPQAFQPEAIGRPDFMTTSMEVIRLVALLALTSVPRSAPAPHSSRRTRYLLAAVIFAVAALLTRGGLKGAARHSHGVALPAAAAPTVAR